MSGKQADRTCSKRLQEVLSFGLTRQFVSLFFLVKGADTSQSAFPVISELFENVFL